MEPSNFYYTIAKEGISEYKDRGSRFIAYAYPVKSLDEIKQHIAHLKKEHPKAVHHCFAWRLGLGNLQFRQSDDGEPSGSAGRPILGQIDSRQLTNVLVVVVRYFGGTLLGVPGLIQAYKSSAAFALQTTPIIKKDVTTQLQLQFDYTKMDQVMHLMKQYDAQIIKKDAQLFFNLLVEVSIQRKENLMYQLRDLPFVEVQEMN
ncbi:MAG: YigZ family protein [Hydrotalea sp.]|nr:YigZ family protein [Hydrotalea sp.]